MRRAKHPRDAAPPTHRRHSWPSMHGNHRSCATGLSCSGSPQATQLQRGLAPKGCEGGPPRVEGRARRFGDFAHPLDRQVDRVVLDIAEADHPIVSWRSSRRPASVFPCPRGASRATCGDVAACHVRARTTRQEHRLESSHHATASPSSEACPREVPVIGSPRQSADPRSRQAQAPLRN
jgi:hypothetical protein